MSAERWHQVDKIAHDVLDREPHERAAFLDKACADDTSLRNDVEVLIRSHEEAGSFLEPPARKASSSWAGRSFGSYQVKTLLGSGGMGEVYRAWDSKLKRDVAIKVLPDEFSRDPERVSRFQREAEVLASLNHPHIGAIYDLAEFGEAKFLVLELVEAETLADRLRRGPIPIQEALRIASQIAEAVEAAHEKGIIHRDLKPANIKIAPDGNVKVLDFGLAKVRGPQNPANLSNSPTMLSATTPGMILGTAAYMSPEQAKGREADRTSDIWSFGCVLYEMLSGRRPFEGESLQEILARVLEKEPDWQGLPADTPEGIRRLLRRCLQKEPKDRLRDIGDARFEIDDARRVPAVDGEVAPKPSRRRERLAWSSAVALLTLIAAGIAIWAFRGQSFAPETRLEITTPPATWPDTIAISPDGRKVVFEGISKGQSQLWLYSFDSGATRPLAGTENAGRVFWKPDGRSVGFFTRGFGKLKTIEIESGSVQTLADVDGGIGTWSRDGFILFSSIGGTILRIPENGGESVRVGAGTHPQFLPDGHHFLYHSYYQEGSGGVYVADLEGSVPQHLLDADSPAVYASSGHLLFRRQQALYAQAFDAVRLKVTGNPFLVAEQIYSVGLTMGVASVSETGTVVYRSGSATLSQFVRFDRSGKEIGRVGEPYISTFGMSLSPDGRRVALNRNNNVWLLDVPRGVFTPFTLDGGLAPLWSTDGKRIAFVNHPRGKGVRDRLADGGGPEQLLWPLPYSGVPTDWSSDGRFLLYSSMNTGVKDNDLWALPLDANHKPNGQPIPIVQTDSAIERNGQFSPDQKWIAYQSNKSGRSEIYAQPFPGPGEGIPISSNGGAQPRWRDDGGELFYIDLDGRLMAVPIGVTSRGLDPGSPVYLFTPHIAFVDIFIIDYAPFPGGQEFLVNVVQPVTTPLAVILNWKAKP